MRACWWASCLIFTLAAPVSAQVIGGTATVIDGDTLDFAGTYVRLAGIDAPAADLVCTRAGENWACGEEARQVLVDLIADRKVRCVVEQSNQTGNFAHCTADGIDLSDAMVRAGFAVVPASIGPGYAEAQDVARKFSLGIWGSQFEDSVTWRPAKPPAVSLSPTALASAAPPKPRTYRDNLGRCAIKGNRSYRGDWIYYLPGQNYYDETRPEDRFCTEGAAQRAGYRPSRAG